VTLARSNRQRRERRALFIAPDRVCLGSSPEERRRDPLNVATRNDHAAVTAALLRAGAQADTVWSDEKGTPFTALSIAAREGHEAVVTVLLQLGADPNGTNGDLLRFSAEAGHGAVVIRLLASGTVLAWESSARRCRAPHATVTRWWSWCF